MPFSSKHFCWCIYACWSIHSPCCCCAVTFSTGGGEACPTSSTWACADMGRILWYRSDEPIWQVGGSIAEHTILCFQGTTMCHKFINNAPDHMLLFFFYKLEIAEHSMSFPPCIICLVVCQRHSNPYVRSILLQKRKYPVFTLCDRSYYIYIYI